MDFRRRLIQRFFPPQNATRHATNAEKGKAGPLLKAPAVLVTQNVKLS
jgi:hypothetical protein